MIQSDYNQNDICFNYDTCILFIYLFGVLRRFQHCIGHITMGSWKGRGNQYIEFARVPYCKLPTNGKQLPAFPHKALTGIEPRPQRWEAKVLSLCHRGPYDTCNVQSYSTDSYDNENFYPVTDSDFFNSAGPGFEYDPQAGSVVSSVEDDTSCHDNWSWFDSDISYTQSIVRVYTHENFHSHTAVLSNSDDHEVVQ